MGEIFLAVAFTSIIVISGCLFDSGSETETAYSGVSTTASVGGVPSNLDLLKSGATIKCSYKIDDNDATVYVKGDKFRVEVKSKDETMTTMVKTLPNGSTELSMQVPGYTNTWLKLIVPEPTEEESAGGVQTTGIDFTLGDIMELREVLDDVDCSTAPVGDDYFEVPADAKVIGDFMEAMGFTETFPEGFEGP